MLSIKDMVFMAFIVMAFVVCVKFSQKYCKKLNLKWWKLFLELFVIGFIFYISILAFGLFGAELTGLEGDMWLFEVLILLVIPGLFVVITQLVIPAIMRKIYKNYEEEGGRRLLLLHCLVFNRFYKITILANALHWLTSKIF